MDFLTTDSIRVIASQGFASGLLIGLICLTIVAIVNIFKRIVNKG